MRPWVVIVLVVLVVVVTLAVLAWRYFYHLGHM